MKFDWLFKVPVAHRGLHDDELPENSMPAFAAAIEHGFNIEIDVHLSSDGHLVVFHDDNLKRVCGIDKKVKDCTVEEQTKCHCIHQTEDECRSISAPTEKLVGDDTGKHCTDNSTNRTDRNDKTGVQCRISFLGFQIEDSPAVYGIAADVHQCTRNGKYPNCGHH